MSMPKSLDQDIRSQVTIPDEATQLAVSLDGVHVPIQRLKGKSRYEPKSLFGPTCNQLIPINEEYSRYREASCGTISFLNNEGEVLHTHYYGRMPQEKKTTLKCLLSSHVREALSLRPDLDVVTIADGAKDNWTSFEETFPEAIKTLDFYHAAEHLKQAINQITKDETLARRQFEEKRHQLRHNKTGIDQVIRWLKKQYKGNPSPELETEITYFTNNRDRCFYKNMKEEKRPIGSGIVEAACKSLVSKRLKCSGMAWRWTGGQAILNFRGYLKSKLFDELWLSLEEIYQQKTVQFTFAS